MTMAERRVEIAQALTANLPEIVIEPYKDSSPAPFTGWLQVNRTDTEGCTYGEVCLTVECLILVATDRTDFEKVQDTLTVPLLNAISTVVGGRGTTVEPAEINIDTVTLYCLSATFITETSI
jgi:hypothetical protein